MDRAPPGGPGLLNPLRAKRPAPANCLFLAGLLAFLLPLAGRLEAQVSPRLETATFPQSPLAGEYWAIRFLVDHPLPREVEAELPPLPPALSLDRIRVEPRITEGPDGTARRQTMLEYYFFLNAPGLVSLGPFELSVPAPEDPERPEAPEDPEKTGDEGNKERRIRFLSPAVQFLVRAPGEAGAGRPSPARSPRLSWKGIPALLHPGEEAELTLAHQGWDPRLPLPSPQTLMPRTPIGAILEASPPREDDEAAGVLLRLRLIPLEEGRLNIPGFSVPAGDYSLDVPALSVPVSRGGNRDQTAASDPAAPGSSPEEPFVSPAPPARENLSFPQTALDPFPPFRAGCGSIREQAKALWDRGLRVEALAELRRNERDYTGGPALIPLRRDLEKTLGLSGNGDETWRPSFLLAAVFAVSAALALASLFLSFLPPKKRVTPGLAWCYKVVGNLSRFRLGQPRLKKPARFFRFFTVFFALPALFALWRLGDFSRIELSLPGLSSLSRPALTREADAFRIPGPESAAAFRFEEGCRVLVRSLRGSWAYAEIPDRKEGGRAGWVRVEELVFY